MGGYGSGRTRRYVGILDCLELDTMWLNKQKLLRPGIHVFTIHWYRWTETNFKDRKERVYKASASTVMNEQPSVILSYGVERTFEYTGKVEKQTYLETLPLVSTPCNYGGKRWWFVAPCCHRRVRALYVSLKADIGKMQPMCRTCQGVHYASQQASYEERHASYERHLLRNYGYYYACDEYHMMKKHYFEVTPEYAYKAQRSELERQLHLMRLFIRTERTILRTHACTLASLKSDEDRRAYLEHITRENGQKHALDLLRLLNYSIKAERGVFEVSNAVLDSICSRDLEDEQHSALITDQGARSRLVDDLALMIEKQKQLEEELAELEQAA